MILTVEPVATSFRRALPPDVALASKTGGMPRVRAEAGIVRVPGRPYAFAVMTTFDRYDEACQDALLSDLCRTSYEHMRALANTNEFGLALPAGATQPSSSPR